MSSISINSVTNLLRLIIGRLLELNNSQAFLFVRAILRELSLGNIKFKFFKA